MRRKCIQWDFKNSNFNLTPAYCLNTQFSLIVLKVSQSRDFSLIDQHTEPPILSDNAINLRTVTTTEERVWGKNLNKMENECNLFLSLPHSHIWVYVFLYHTFPIPIRPFCQPCVLLQWKKRSEIELWEK